jgi:5'-nucleotidase
MKILVSNDDGVDSPGLDALIAGLDMHEVEFVVPNGERSAMSSALTPRVPVSAYPSSKYPGIRGWTITGTPADCVQVGLDCLLEHVPDCVVSGINTGANLGDDILYSGTVGAAWEGRILDKVNIAFSLNARQSVNWPAASEIVRRVMQSTLVASLPAGSVLNVNIPDLPLNQIKGARMTQMGRRGRFGLVTRTEHQIGDGSVQVMLGAQGRLQTGEVGTDIDAIAQGYVSLTPLKLDSTDLGLLRQSAHQLEEAPLW